MAIWVLQVKIIPNAPKNQIVGWEEDVLKLKIKGVPEKGKVNAELISFLAKHLKIAKSNIKILTGHSSRLKRLQIDGLDDLSALSAHRL